MEKEMTNNIIMYEVVKNYTIIELFLILIMLPLPSYIYAFVNEECNLSGSCFGCFSFQLHQIFALAHFVKLPIHIHHLLIFFSL